VRVVAGVSSVEHPGTAQVVFADGSVRSVRDSIDPKVFEALATIAGGERLPAGWDR
jgi:prepilin-type processing-associated H-X9-DG protein